MLSPRYLNQHYHSMLPAFSQLASTRASAALFIMAGALLFCSAVHAADNTSASANADYQRQRSSCMDGSSNQDRATCLREAGAALQAARKGQLTDPQSDLEKNRLSRCNALPEQDRPDCVQRMEPGGVVDGSSRSGGILRQSVTTEVGPPVIIMPPDNAMPAGSQ